MMDIKENESSASKRPTDFCGLHVAGKDAKKVANEDRCKKRMKKDDSGINVIEESDNSCDDESNQENRTGEDKCDNVGNKTHCDPNSPDSGHLEFSNFSGESDNHDKATVSPDTSAKKFDEVSVEGNKDSSIDGSEADIIKCDSDIDKDDEIVKKDEYSKYDPTPNTPKPKHNWNALSVVTNRQYGSALNYSPHLFRYSCYSSLHMVERLELMYKMRKHDGCVNTLHFNTKGTKLVTGSDDLDIIIWDWTLSEPKIEYSSGHRSNVFQAKFMPLSGDCNIVSCARDGQVRLGELASQSTTKAYTKKLAQHKGAAHKLTILLDSPHTFLSCGEDAAVFEVDLRKEKAEKLVMCKEEFKKVPLYSISSNPIKSYEFVVGGKDQFVRVYDSRFINEGEGFLKKYCPQHLVNGSKANVTSVVYNYNGQEILSSYNDEDIYSFKIKETDTNKYSHRYRGHRNSQTVKAVNYFGTKSEYVISGSDCGYIFFWEKESEHIVKYMYGDEGGVVNCLEPNPNMPVLATSGLDDDIKIWVPSCEDLPNMSNLRYHICSNMKEREEDQRLNCPEEFDDQMLWILIQHLRRNRARATDTTSNSSFSDSGSNSDVPEDEADEEPQSSSAMQCNQS